MTSTAMPVIPLKTYRFYFNTAAPVRLPEYPGSAWRGAFGHALKRTVCVVRNTPCQACLLRRACAYSYVFETPPPANTEKMRKYNTIPHPFVFRFAANGLEYAYSLDLTLFGHGLRFFPYIIHAMQTAGQDGIGGSRHAFLLNRIDEIDFQGRPVTVYEDGHLQQLEPAQTPAAPDMPAKIRLTFHSPVRIKHDSKNLAAGDFSFGALFSALLRRISMLSYFYTDTPLDTDFAALTAAARMARFSEQNLRWYDWTRYSSRQQTEMNLGGLIGNVSLDMQGMDDFWPYLWLGQWTHVGKATSMGLGAYSIGAASLSTSR